MTHLQDESAHPSVVAFHCAPELPYGLHLKHVAILQSSSFPPHQDSEYCKVLNEAVFSGRYRSCLLQLRA